MDRRGKRLVNSFLQPNGVRGQQWPLIPKGFHNILKEVAQWMKPKYQKKYRPSRSERIGKYFYYLMKLNEQRKREGWVPS